MQYQQSFGTDSIMKSLSQLPLTNKCSNESMSLNIAYDDIIDWFKPWIYEHNSSIDSWIYETYDNASGQNCLIDEEEFYWNKYQTHSLEDLGWPHFVFWQTALYERLGKSIQLNDKELEEIQSIRGVIAVNAIHKNKSYKCKILYGKNIDVDKLIMMMNFYGYALDTNIKLNEDIYEAYFEAIHLNEIDYDYDYIYHVTTKNKLNKIKKYGLIPKQKINHHEDYIEMNKNPFEYPSKIYCFSQDINKNMINGFIGLQSKLKNIPKNDFICLRINVRQYNSDRYPGKMKLMSDPAYNITGAMFTYEPIPSKYIEEINYEEIK